MRYVPQSHVVRVRSPFGMSAFVCVHFRFWHFRGFFTVILFVFSDFSLHKNEKTKEDEAHDLHLTVLCLFSGIIYLIILQKVDDVYIPNTVL